MIRQLHPDVDIERICSERSEIDKALDRAGRSARLRHKQLGVPLVVWQDGKVIVIPPEEIVVDPPMEDEAGRQARS